MVDYRTADPGSEHFLVGQAAAGGIINRFCTSGGWQRWAAGAATRQADDGDLPHRQKVQAKVSVGGFGPGGAHRPYEINRSGGQSAAAGQHYGATGATDSPIGKCHIDQALHGIPPGAILNAGLYHQAR